MNAEFKKHVQEPYNEAWDIMKTIRDDDSDEAWNTFREKLDQFYKRIDAVKPKGSDEYIKGEHEYLMLLYSTMLEMGEMAAWILKEGDKDEKTKTQTTR